MKNKYNRLYGDIIEEFRNEKNVSDIAESDAATFRSLQEVKRLAAVYDLHAIATQGVKMVIAYHQVAMLFNVKTKTVEIAVLTPGQERSSKKLNYSCHDEMCLIIENVIATEDSRVLKDIKECVSLLKAADVDHQVYPETGLVMLLSGDETMITINHKNLNYSYHNITDKDSYLNEPKNFKLYDWREIPEVKRLQFHTT